MADVVELKMGCRRQDDICQLCGGGHEYLGDSQKIEPLEGFKGFAGIGVAEEWIAALDVQPSDGIGFSGEDRLYDELGRDKASHGCNPELGGHHLFSLIGESLDPDEG